MTRQLVLSRRKMLRSIAAFGAALAIAPRSRAAQASPILTKKIPASGEELPVIGMGSWITFNVGDDKSAIAARTEVLRAFFNAGGGLIDSSPMYGSSQAVIGHGLARLGRRKRLFSATKVWTWMGSRGPGQIEDSRAAWGVKKFDLLMVHNLLSWRKHLATLLDMKARGELRYIGVTTSHGRRHGELAKIIKTQPIDFVQFTYNIADRQAERLLLPLANERGIAVIVNRPFQRGALIERLQKHPLPRWAGEIDCRNWPQFLLKFVVSHPGVTCAIPATSRVDHMRQNMGAASGVLPDARMRERMIGAIEAL